MSVDDHSGCDPEGLPENDIRSLPSYAGKLNEVLHSFGNPRIVPFDECFAAGDDVLRLHPEEPRRVDFPFEFRLRHSGKILGLRIPGEERPRHHVYPLVSTLRRQNRGDEKLEWIVVKQLGARPWEFFEQNPENLLPPCPEFFGRFLLPVCRR